jgi:hypothetical protein
VARGNSYNALQFAVSRDEGVEIKVDVKDSCIPSFPQAVVNLPTILPMLFDRPDPILSRLYNCVPNYDFT